MYCIEESTCDIVGTFQRPHSDSAPRELCPSFLPGCRPYIKTYQLMQSRRITRFTLC